MTIRETTALVMLYRACLTAKTAGELRYTAWNALEYVPELAEFSNISWPFYSHRTQAEVMMDDAN